MGKKFEMNKVRINVKRFSDDVGMQLVREKFAKDTFKESFRVKSKNFTRDINVKITVRTQQSL